MSKLEDILKIVKADVSTQKSDDDQFVSQLEQYAFEVQGIVNVTPGDGEDSSRDLQVAAPQPACYK